MRESGSLESDVDELLKFLCFELKHEQHNGIDTLVIFGRNGKTAYHPVTMECAYSFLRGVAYTKGW